MKSLYLLAVLCLFFTSVCFGDDVSAKTKAHVQAVLARKHDEETAKASRDAAIKNSVGELQKTQAVTARIQFEEKLAAAEKTRLEEENRQLSEELRAASEKFQADQKRREIESAESQTKMSRDFEAMMDESLASRLALEADIRRRQKKIDRMERSSTIVSPRVVVSPPAQAPEDSQKPQSGTIVAPNGVSNYWTNKDGTFQISGPEGLITVFPDKE